MTVRPPIEDDAADQLRQARRDMSASAGQDLTLSEVIRRLVEMYRRATSTARTTTTNGGGQ